MRQALQQGKPLSHRLIAKVEPGSTFATAIVRQRPIFMTPSFVSLGTSGNFARESGEGRKLRMVTCPSQTFPFHFVFGHCAFSSADTLQWILRTFPAFSPSETFDSGEELNDHSQVNLFAFKRHGHDCRHRRGDVCGGSEALPMLVGCGIPRL